jgi:hypothetical protein
MGIHWEVPFFITLSPTRAGNSQMLFIIASEGTSESQGGKEVLTLQLDFSYGWVVECSGLLMPGLCLFLCKGPVSDL